MTTSQFDYPSKRAIADRLLTKFGQAISLRRTVNTGTPFNPTQTTTDYATIAAVVDYSIQDRRNSDILATDRRALVAAGPLTLAGITSLLPGDALVIGGVAVTVVIGKPLNPAGVTVVYDCQIRA